MGKSRGQRRQVRVEAKADKQGWELGMVGALVDHQAGESVDKAQGEVLAGIEVQHNGNTNLDRVC